MMRVDLRKALAAAVALTTACPPSAIAAECGFKAAFQRPDEKGTRTVTVYQGDPIAALGGLAPLLFISNLKVNTDGTKISYHPADPTGRRCATDPTKTPCAINNVRNAYSNPARPVSDFEVVRDAGYPAGPTWSLLSPSIIERSSITGKPCLTADGYLVSMTADVSVPAGFNRVGDCDIGKWIDAVAIPALVLPKASAQVPSQFVQRGMRKRSLVVAVAGGATARVVPGVVGDFGPTNELGEASIAMNRDLNGLAASDKPKHRQDAIDRFQAPKAALLLFPGAAQVLERPITADRVSSAGNLALEKFGGADKLYRCIREEIDPQF